MDKKNLIIFDSDSLAFIGSKDDTLQQVIEKVDYKIAEVLKETDADYYVLLLSQGKYFRHDISKSLEAPRGTYKANRAYGTQIWVNAIKEYLKAQYGAVWYPKLEADDIAAWLMASEILYGKVSSIPEDTRYELCLGVYPKGHPNTQKVNKILVAKDKDLLYSIPGKHLNFSCKLDKDTWGMKWVETGESEAASFVKSQMIIGDASDGIPGLHRKGKVYWDKISKEIIPSWGEILTLYQVDYGENKGIYEFQKNYRMLKMLTEDEEYLREVGYIPELPVFQQVNKKVKPEEIDF